MTKQKWQILQLLPIIIFIACLIIMVSAVVSCKPAPAYNTEVTYRGSVSDEEAQRVQEIDRIVQTIKDKNKTNEILFGSIGSVFALLLTVQISINRGFGKVQGEHGSRISSLEKGEQDRDKFCDLRHSKLKNQTA